MPQLFTTPGGVPYEFTRKRVKNINVRVRRDGTVAVSAPLRAPLADVERFLASKENWLAQARRRALAAACLLYTSQRQDAYRKNRLQPVRCAG